MSRHAATRSHAAATTVVILAAMLAGFAAGIPITLYALTRDWAVAGRTILLAATIAATAIDLLWMASSVRRLAAVYRAERRAVRLLAGLPDVDWEQVTEMVLAPAGEVS